MGRFRGNNDCEEYFRDSDCADGSGGFKAPKFLCWPLDIHGRKGVHAESDFARAVRIYRIGAAESLDSLVIRRIGGVCDCIATKFVCVYGVAEMYDAILVGL